MIAQIPFSQQVITYLQNKVGSEILEFNRKFKLSMLIIQSFRRKRFNDEPVNVGDTYLQVKLTERKVRENETYLNKKGVAFLEKYILNEIKEDVFNEVQKRMLINDRCKQSEALRFALEYFGLNEDVLPYETAKKFVDRKFKKLEAQSK